MVEEIKTQVEVNLDNRTYKKDGTLRKKRPVIHDDLFSIRMKKELLKKIQTLDNWQQWARDLLEKEINLAIDKAKEI